MSVFTLILLLVIIYYVCKSLRTIWRDAFKGVGNDPDANSSKRQCKYTQQQSSHTQQHTGKPIEKGEGEYVDFTEER